MNNNSFHLLSDSVNLSITNTTISPIRHLEGLNLSKPVKLEDDDDDDDDDGFDFVEFHSISMAIVWSCFNFVGHFGARFLKHYPWWIYLHYIGSVLTTVWSFFLLIITIIYGKIVVN
jgi:hypothetical protein